MALIVEDGTGKPDAESYCTVAFADEYHQKYTGSQMWTELDTAAKERLLRVATTDMVGKYRARWKGWRTGAIQALDWPRNGCELDDTGYPLQENAEWARFITLVPGNVVPVEVQRACAHLALIANAQDLAPTLSRARIREKLGKIEVEYDPYSPQAPRFTAVNQMLSPYLKGAAAGGMSLVRR